jgi:hypothetical protein
MNRLEEPGVRHPTGLHWDLRGVAPETTSRPAYYPFLGPLLLMTIVQTGWETAHACLNTFIYVYVRQVWPSHLDSTEIPTIAPRHSMLIGCSGPASAAKHVLLWLHRDRLNFGAARLVERGVELFERPALGFEAK